MSESSKPPVIRERPSDSPDAKPYCTFCTIVTHFQPISPEDTSNAEWDPEKLTPPSYVLMANEHLIAFLDIAPLVRGHVLVAPRRHRVKMGDLKGEEMAEIGRRLPMIARAVTRSVLPDIPHDEVDYNIVQNNGPGAAQVIPHVHFHIVPRPPLNYQHPTASSSSSSISTNTKRKKYPPSKLPNGVQQSYIQFGRGQRHELDDDDAVDLVKLMRQNLKEEWTKETSASSPSSSSADIPQFTGDAEEAAWIEGGAGLVSNLQRRGSRSGKL